jgi:hypothetical protein
MNDECRTRQFIVHRSDFITRSYLSSCLGSCLVRPDIGVIKQREMRTARPNEWYNLCIGIQR